MVDPGMTKNEVLDVMGLPALRSFKGKKEALQFCSDNYAGKHTYVVVWMVDGAVYAITNHSIMSSLSIPTCESGLKEIDWGQAPPVKRYDIRVR